MLTLKVLFHRLVETHIFCFVVGRAFVTDIEKLKVSSQTRSLEIERVIGFFSDATEVCLFSFSHVFMSLVYN